MADRYLPGAPNPYFPKHRYHGIPVGRNIQPVAQAQVAYVDGADGGSRRAVEVEILTAEHLWATFQVEAEALLKVGGHWIDNDKERNRRINAAYARLWLADRRFQWAGLAAFASKQVGCGLLHAADLIEDSRRQREDIERSLGHGAVPGVQYGATMKQLTTEMAAGDMARRLGYGNKHLFLDIYPLHRFYMERGWDEFRVCLPKRQTMRYPVEWQVDRKVLPFGKLFDEVLRGFGHIEEGSIGESVALLARHEQVNILQALIYQDSVMRRLLAVNQFAWATGFPTGRYEEIQLTLSAQCRARTGITSWFSKDKYAKLWNTEDRMRFVLAAADRFEILLNGRERPDIEESIRTISAGGGVA
jgi:hypothetical protein